jgi:L-aminopeptidase/D-esterase-like protein
MYPASLVDAVHGLLLAGGSAFGLAAADGIVRFLREQGHGFVMPHGVVPIVPGAVIYDLDVNRNPGLLPDAAMGYAAARGATERPVPRGRVGAGTGARCGRMFGLTAEQDHTSPAGLGSALVESRGILVGALVVLNSLGNVHDPDSGLFLAGGRDADGQPFSRETVFSTLASEAIPQTNTVLTVVATNVPLGKAAATRLARMASGGLARAIRPAHLVHDGDIVFALSAKTGLPPSAGPWTENLLGAMSAEAAAQAVVDAVRPRGQY